MKCHFLISDLRSHIECCFQSYSIEFDSNVLIKIYHELQLKSVWKLFLLFFSSSTSLAFADAAAAAVVDPDFVCRYFNQRKDNLKVIEWHCKWHSSIWNVDLCPIVQQCPFILMAINGQRPDITWMWRVKRVVAEPLTYLLGIIGILFKKIIFCFSFIHWAWLTFFLLEPITND